MYSVFHYKLNPDSSILERTMEFVIFNNNDAIKWSFIWCEFHYHDCCGRSGVGEEVLIHKIVNCGQPNVYIFQYICCFHSTQNKPLNVEYLTMDASILLQPTGTPLTGIEFSKRLPCGEVERARKVSHFEILTNKIRGKQKKPNSKSAFISI